MSEESETPETASTVADGLDAIPVERLTDEQIAELEKLKQELVYVGIDDIHLSPNKERKNDAAVPKVAESIRQCGFRSPIYVNGETNEIDIGHTRWKAAKKLGFRTVPVVFIFDLSPSKLKLLKLADNKVAEFSGWDFTELNKTLDELKIELPDLDFGDLGFVDSPEIQWEDEKELSEDTYEEPTENDMVCPKCGYRAKKSFFAYTDRYIEFIKDYDRPNVVGYFEMDVDKVIGLDKVNELRRRLERVTDKIIPVWHRGRGIENFKEMCRTHEGRVVAITGFMNEDIKDDQYLMFLKYARDCGCRVHCLGMTRKKVLDKVPFDYTDSSTWLQRVLYGMTQNNQKVRVKRDYIKAHRGEVYIESYLNAMKEQQHYAQKWAREFNRELKAKRRT